MADAIPELQLECDAATGVVDVDPHLAEGRVAESSGSPGLRGHAFDV